MKDRKRKTRISAPSSWTHSRSTAASAAHAVFSGILGGQLQLEVLEKRSEYREFPTEKNRKYIETREREIEEMDEFMEARDMDMIRNYKEEINDLCKMLADMSISFAGAAPSSYVEFKNANAKVRRVLIMHGGA